MENYVSLIAIILWIIVIIFLIIRDIKSDIEWLKIYRKKKQKEIDDNYNNEVDKLQLKIDSLTQSIKEKELLRDTIIQKEEEIIQKQLQLYKTEEKQKIDDSLREENNKQLIAFQVFYDNIENAKQTCIQEITELTNTLNELKQKRDAANEEIRRNKEIQDNKDFYTINIDESSKHDLELLDSIKIQLNKRDLIDKLIYDNYIAKPVNEMTKRILNGAPSGIYKITRLKTGEVYIGKSTDVKTRWQQHCKSAYHCGTISHSLLHTIMEKDKVWNFTFELLEEVPKEKLTEREKYWIEFYDSKNFGLNERNG